MPLAAWGWGYLSFVKWLLLRSVPHLRLLLRTLMLALILGGAEGRGVAFGAHCAQHSREASSPAVMAAHKAATTPDRVMATQTKHRLATDQARSWSARASSGHQCPHCPPAECATALPCASGLSSQSAPGAGPVMTSLVVHALRELAPLQHAASVHSAPPTPPPQAAA